jgi:hypothetical protein
VSRRGALDVYRGALLVTTAVMRAAWFLTRGELKRRWPSLLLLAVLVAAVGGVTLPAGASDLNRTLSS